MPDFDFEILPNVTSIEVVGSPSETINVLSTKSIVEVQGTKIDVAIPEVLTIIGSDTDASIGASFVYPIADSGVVAGKVVKLVMGELFLASASDSESANPTGVFDGSRVISSGRMTYGGWNWATGIPLFLGRNGEMIQVPHSDPDILFMLQIGVALTPQQILINIQQPLYLG